MLRVKSWQGPYPMPVTKEADVRGCSPRSLDSRFSSTRIFGLSWADWAVLLIFIAAGLAAVLHHVPGMDEAQGWLIARDLSIPGIPLPQFSRTWAPLAFGDVVSVEAKYSAVSCGFYATFVSAFPAVALPHPVSQPSCRRRNVPVGIRLSDACRNSTQARRRCRRPLPGKKRTPRRCGTRRR